MTVLQWNCNAPIFEVRMKTLNCQINWCPDKSESSTSMQIEVDYHDMEKVCHAIGTKLLLAFHI